MKTNRLAQPANSSGTLYGRVITSALFASNPVFSQLTRACLRLVGAFSIALFAWSATASAVGLKWNPNPETNIASYRLSYGTSPGSHPNSVNSGLNTRATVTGLQEGTTYYFVVTAINTDGQESEPSNELSYQVPVIPTVPVTVIPRSSWTLQSVDSEETIGYSGTRAFDGNAATFWHTGWSSGTTPPPHEIRIDLGAIHPVNGFRYLPRQDSLLVGNISQYEFYVSLDGATWGDPVASGTFASSSSEKEVLFASRNARYVRLRSLSEVGGGHDCNVAELNVLQDATVNPPGNHAPITVSKAVNTTEDLAVGVILSASDADGQSLSYSIVSGPTKGTLSGTAPNLTYTPNSDTNGADSFTYKANDGSVDSNTATVSITVSAVNDAPVAVSKSATTNEDTSVSITLAASDKEGNSLTWSIVTAPAKGTLSGTAPNLTYTPNSDTNGADSFTYQANDGSVNSNVATVFITVTAKETGPPNSPPVFKSNPITLQGGTEEKSYTGISIGDAASDPDKGDSITFSKVSGPEWLAISAAGKLSGTPPTGSEGMNRFTVRATDKAEAYADSILLIVIAAADLPLPWDIEQLGKSGRKARAAFKSGTFTLEGSGNSAGISDAGCFIWQTLSGDGTITARVNTLEDAGKIARAGLMIRDSLAENSKHAFIGVNGSGDFRWVRRTRTGGQAVIKSAGVGATPNAWLRLTRKGDTIIACKSANGSDWTRVGSTKADFGNHCYIGLSISSGKSAPSIATFRSVKVKP